MKNGVQEIINKKKKLIQDISNLIEEYEKDTGLFVSDIQLEKVYAFDYEHSHSPIPKVQIEVMLP